MQEGNGFSANTLRKSLFRVKMTGPAMVRPASSDFWKAHFNVNFHFGGQQCSVGALMALIASRICKR